VTNVFVGNANLIKKINFPEETLIIQELFSSLITLAISYSIFTLIIFVFGGWRPTPHILLLPGIVALQVFFSLGIAFGIATLNVFLRDIGQILAVVMMAWFWLTPIVYPSSIVFHEGKLLMPEWLWLSYTLNPWYYLSKWYREAFYMETVPEFNEVLVFAALTTLIVYFGVKIYKSLRNDIPDMI
jgi:lipopolysaccharide transport system permease protein